MGHAVPSNNSDPPLLARRPIKRDGAATGGCELIYSIARLQPGDQLTAEGRKAVRDVRWNLHQVLMRSI